MQFQFLWEGPSRRPFIRAYAVDSRLDSNAERQQGTSYKLEGIGRHLISGDTFQSLVALQELAVTPLDHAEDVGVLTHIYLRLAKHVHVLNRHGIATDRSAEQVTNDVAREVRRIRRF